MSVNSFCVKQQRSILTNFATLAVTDQQLSAIISYGGTEQHFCWYSIGINWVY